MYSIYFAKINWMLCFDFVTRHMEKMFEAFSTKLPKCLPCNYEFEKRINDCSCWMHFPFSIHTETHSAMSVWPEQTLQKYCGKFQWSCCNLFQTVIKANFQFISKRFSTSQTAVPSLLNLSICLNKFSEFRLNLEKYYTLKLE